MKRAICVRLCLLATLFLFLPALAGAAHAQRVAPERAAADLSLAGDNAGSAGTGLEAAPPPVHGPAPAHGQALPNGTVIRDHSTGDLYLIWDARRYLIPSLAVLDTLGYSHGAILNLMHASVVSLRGGPPLSLRSPANPASPVAIGSAMLRVRPAAAPGASVPALGTGFAPGETVQLTVGTSTISVVADGSGAFQASVTVPAGAKAGSLLQVYAYGTRSKILEVEPLRVTSPGAPAPATIVLTPPGVHPGDKISVSGINFAADEQVAIQLNGATVLTVRTDAIGTFAATFAVPSTLPAGSYTVRAVSASGRASAALAVVSAPGVLADGTVIRDHSNGNLYLVWAGTRYFIPGLDVIDILGYSHGAILNLAHGSVVSLHAGPPLSLRSPVNPASPVAIGSAMLRVRPTAPSGASVTVVGSGFAPDEKVQLAMGASAAIATADGRGAFQATVTVPAGTKAGSILQVYAYGTSSKILEVEPLRVTSPGVPAPAAISLTPPAIHPGQNISIGGVDFAANEQVAIQISGATVLTVQADATGTFGVSYTVPTTTPPGTYTVRAVGTSNRASATLAVSSVPGALADGTVVRDQSDGNLYLVWAGTRHFIPSLAVIDTLGYSHGAILNLTHGTVTHLAPGTPLSLRSPANPNSPVAIGSATLAVTPPAAATGAPVALSGAGFGPNELVQITVARVFTVTPADAHGAFHTSIAVPAGVKAGSILQVYAYGTRSKILEVEPLKVS